MAYQERIEAAKRAREVEEQRAQERAAEKAAYVIDGAECPPPDFLYLTKKQIGALPGLYYSKDKRLIIPITDGEQTTSLQYIAADGEKRFLTGGKIKGCFHRIDGDSRIIICEGYATGATLHRTTGATVYVAFNCGNLYDVACYVKAQHHGAHITICADNDHKTEANPGITKARQVAEGLSLHITWPEFDADDSGTDFNDLYCQKGEGAVKAYFTATEKRKQESASPQPQSPIAMPHGFLSQVYDYYMATSGNYQPGFAAQTALATASILLSRRFVTDAENFASLFFINVAKSGTGKEHSKTVIERILHAIDCSELINGDGYTSGGAVLSSLLFSPRHITIIDEMGRYLEASGNNARTNNHLREANTRLMEAVGRCHSVMRPQSYSTMTLNKDQAAALRGRYICNPAITLVGMSTPSTLFKSLTADAIKDGFINRFVISISDAERDIRRPKPFIEVPETITSWAETIEQRASVLTEEPSEPAQPIEVVFSESAYRLQEDFQRFCIEQANNLEAFGMEELPGRCNEMAMRIALIVALSENPHAEHITAAHMEWAIDYMRRSLEQTIKSLKMSISGSEHEGDKKEVLAALRKDGDWVRRSYMPKTPPYSKFKRKELSEILDSLEESGLIESRPADMGSKGGRPTTEYRAA